MGELDIRNGYNCRIHSAGILDDHSASVEVRNVVIQIGCCRNRLVHSHGLNVSIRIDAIDLNLAFAANCLDCQMNLIQILIGIIQVERNRLTVGQINLIVGAVVSIILNLCNFVIAVDKHNAVNGLAAQAVEGICSKNLVSKLLVHRPAFAILNVCVIRCLILVTGRIVDPDCIQDKLVTTSTVRRIASTCLIVIEDRTVCSCDRYSVLAVLQTGQLNNRNLIQRIVVVDIRVPVITDHSVGVTHLGICGPFITLGGMRCLCNPLCGNLRNLPTGLGIDIVDLAVTIGITVVGIHNQILIAGACNLYRNGASSVAGQGYDIETGTVELEGCNTASTGGDIDPSRGTQRILAHFSIGTVITIDVVCINITQAVFAGTVLTLSLISGRSDRGPTAISNYSRPSLVGILNLVAQIHKAVLVINSRCGNDGDLTVVILVNVLVGNTVAGGIAECLNAVHCHGIGGVANLVAIHRGNAESTVVGSCKAAEKCVISNGFSICTDADQCAKSTEHIVAQNGNVHRQAVVDDHGIRHRTDDPLHRKVNGGVSVVVRSFADFCSVVIVIGSCIAHDIGRFGMGTGNFPTTAGIAGRNTDRVFCILVIEDIAGSQNILGFRTQNSRAGIQIHGLVKHRLGHLVGSQEVGCLGTVLVQRLAIFVNQIERVADICTAPGHSGRRHALIHIVAQVVGVVQSCVLVGIVGTLRHTAIHGAGQIHHIGQGVLLLVDGADVPVEGLAGQIVGSAVGQSNGLGLGIGIVEEGACLDHTVIQNIAVGFCLDRGGCYDLAIHHGKGNLFRRRDITVSLTDISSILCICCRVNSLRGDCDRGIHLSCANGFALGIHLFCCDSGVHLQVKGNAHLVHEHSIGGCEGNTANDFIKRLIQCFCSLNIGIVVSLTGGNDLDQFLLGSDSDLFASLRTVRCQTKSDGVNGCAQALELLNVGRIIIGGGTKHYIIGFVGVTLDSLGNAVGVGGAVAVVEVAVNCAPIIGLKVCLICPDTLQPIIPFIVCTLAITVVITVIAEGGTVRQEDHILCPLLSIGSFLGFQQSIGIFQSAVVVCTGMTVAICEVTGNGCGIQVGVVYEIICGKAHILDIAACVGSGEYLCVIRIISVGVGKGDLIVRTCGTGEVTVEVDNGDVDIGNLAGSRVRLLELGQHVLQ